MKRYRKFLKANLHDVGQFSRMSCFVRKLCQLNVLHLKETNA